MPIVLVGNRCDLEQEREVATAGEGGGGAPFMDTKAKVGINAEDVFVGLVREVRRMAG